MVGGFVHAAQVVVHPGGLEPRLQGVAGQDHVDAQAALGRVLEAAAAVVEPAEAVIYLGVQLPEAVVQPPILKALQPRAFFRQEAAFTGA